VREGELLHGGYSSAIVVDQGYIVKIPDALPLDKAAPLLCAGITTYSPLVHWGAKAGGASVSVGVVGLGGLGHCAVKFSHAMGNAVHVISTSPWKAAAAAAMGAKFINSKDPSSMAAAAGSLDLIINTVSADHDVAPYLKLLKISGTMVLVGLPPNPLAIRPFDVVGRRVALAGSTIGSIAETQEMLDYAAEGERVGVCVPDVRVIPAKDANHALATLSRNANAARRFVIDVGGTMGDTEAVEEDDAIDPSSWRVLARVLPASANKHTHTSTTTTTTTTTTIAVAAAVVVGVVAAAALALRRR